MLATMNRNIVSVLGLAAAVSSAPLNERANASRGIVGWLCHYDGPSTPLVDASLDLPAILGGLCAKVNYDFPGCESFNPDPNSVIPDQSSPDDGTGVQSASVDQDDDQSNADHKHPKHHPKNKKPHKTHSASFPQDDDNDSNHKKPKLPKIKKPHHQSGDDDDNSVTAHSFHDSSDDEPNSSHSSHGSKPHKSSAKDPNSSVGSLSNGDSEDDGTHGCQSNESYSSELDRCVDQSYFSQPQSDGSCKVGLLDAVLELCLDVSTLGLTDPIHVDAAALKSGAGSTVNQKCPLGQQYSSLLSVCVDDTFFSDPLAGDQCQHGWKLDLVLGICLDLVGCQNQSNDS